jgi:hypothetical protein
MAVVYLVFASGITWADGWHNASLATASLDDWLRDIKAAVPELDKRLQNSKLKAGSSIEDLKNAASGTKNTETDTAGTVPQGGSLKNLTAQQQAILSRKATDCLEVLALMDAKNIFPAEFPTFKLGKIPEYRKAAKELLKAMGPTGATAVANQIRTELMGGNQYARDVALTASYYKELLEVFRDQLEAGEFSLEDLDSIAEAASGMKTQNGSFAKAVTDLMEQHVNLLMLLKWSAATDSRERKRQLANRFQKRLGEARPDELLVALESPELTTTLKTSIANQLAKYVPQASLTELIGMLDRVEDVPTQKAAAVELARRSPAYADVKDDVPALATFYASSKPLVSKGARFHLANAFQRAPISHCLYWLGQGNDRLNAVIWEQVDGRIARADAERRAGYRDTALAVLPNANAGIPSREAALELLVRLKDKQAIGPLLDIVPRLPRELWPPSGSALERMTGQKFGPKAGDGGAEVSVAVKKWREWWKQNGGM